MGNIFCSEAHNTDENYESPSKSGIKALERLQAL